MNVHAVRLYLEAFPGDEHQTAQSAALCTSRNCIAWLADRAFVARTAAGLIETRPLRAQELVGRSLKT